MSKITPVWKTLGTEFSHPQWTVSMSRF